MSRNLPPGGPSYPAPNRDEANVGYETTAVIHGAERIVPPPPLPSYVARRSVRNPTAELIGHFEVIETIGQGGFGTVVKAFDPNLQRVVAIKKMSAELAATSPARKRFIREARAAAAVRHENVVHIYTVESDPSPYLVMEYVPGGSLHQLLNRPGPLEVREAARLGAQVSRGLAAAHALKLVHRDVKPANVMIEPGDQPRAKLTDFGLARAADDASLTQSGTVIGTPMYMAPEQARGETVDHRADLFSLGSVLYAMVTGRPPFRASNSLAVLKRVSEDTPRPIREIIPETPTWMCDIIARLHARNPADRFQSASEVADLLELCLAEEIRGAAVRLPRTRRPGMRWRLLLPAAVLACVAAAITLAPFPPTEKSTEETIDDSAHHSRQAPNSAEQFEGVSADLRRLNPAFNGQIVPRFAAGQLVGLKLTDGNRVRDLSPLRDLRDLRSLVAWSTEVADLSPLRGLPLQELILSNNFRIRDLSPLAGMPLERLEVWGYGGTDLSPLEGMQLRILNCGGGGQKLDLSPLKSMPLSFLCVNQTKTDDLSPLQGVPIEELLIENTTVRDLSPMKGKLLRKASLKGSLVTDLSVLRGMPLAEVTHDFDPKRDAGFLRSFPGLKLINERPAAEFWKEPR